MEFYVFNYGTDDIGAYAPMEVGTRYSDGVLGVKRPSADHFDLQLINGPVTLLAGTDNQTPQPCQVGWPRWVLYSGTAPTEGAEVGVRANGTAMEHDYVGFSVFAVNAAGSVALVFPSRPAPPLFKVSSTSGTSLFARRVNSDGDATGPTGTFHSV